jgi:hypothetical protein
VTERTYPHKTRLIGPLFFGWTKQGEGAPVIDTGHTWSADGWDAGCWVIRLRRTPGRAFMVGWTTRKFIRVPRRLPRVPLLGLLFRARF